MCRRQLLLAAQACSRALQHSQACGQLQLGPHSLFSQLHTAALHAASATFLTQSKLGCAHSSWASTAVQQHAHEGLQQRHQQWAAARWFSTSLQTCSEEDLRIVQAEMSEHDYHRLADETLDHLQEKLEVFVEDQDVDGADVEHAQGVLTVKLGSYGTYVINKQTPNRQIWLSSPVSGPFRYDYHQGCWVYHRDGRELLSQLQQELQQLFGSAPELTSRHVEGWHQDS